MKGGKTMHPPIKIGVDIMGSDELPLNILKALETFSSQNVEIYPIGDSSLKKSSSFPHFVEAKDVIQMDENPLTALRKKKDSSISVGLRLLKEKKIDAFVSAGNTGALISSAKLIVGMCPKISRPALLALIPTKKKPIAILDLGANIQAKAENLVQFAYLGAAYQIANGVKTPNVGILNIGSEAVKGTAEQRAAYLLLEKKKKAPFHFKGNIEGKTVFDGDVDVLVTDGFTGNIFLKTAEGIASLVLDKLYDQIPKEFLEKIQPELNDLKKHLHHTEYPGAILAGVKGIVVKCHGYSTAQGFINAIYGAINLVLNNFEQTFQNQLDKIISKRL